MRHDNNSGLELSPDGSNIACGCIDGSVVVFDRNGKVVLRVQDHADCVSAIAFSRDGKAIASGGDDCTLVVIDRASGKRIWSGKVLLSKGDLPKPDIRRYYTSISFSPDGRTIAASLMDQHTRVWHFADGKSEAALSSMPVQSRCVQSTFLGDGKLAIWGNEDERVFVIEPDNGAIEHIIRPSPAIAGAVVASPRDATFCCAYSNGTVAILKSDNDKQPTILSRTHGDEPLLTIRFSQDARSIITVGMHGAIRTWRVTDGQRLSETQVKADLSRIGRPSRNRSNLHLTAKRP